MRTLDDIGIIGLANSVLCRYIQTNAIFFKTALNECIAIDIAML